MTSYGTVRWVLLVQAVAIVAAAAVTFGHAAWMSWGERRNRARLGRARLALAAALDGPDATPPPQELSALPTRLQARLVTEAAPYLSGRPRLRLSEIASDLALPRRAAALTHRRAWWRRLDGAHLLTMYDLDVGAHYRLLTDAHPAVRAQAATWAGDNPTPGLTRHLVTLLSDAAPLARVTAKDALLRAGGHAIDAIADGLASEDGRHVDDLLDVAARRPDSRYVEPALLLSAATRPSTRAAAAALLGALGGAAPAEALVALLADPASDVRAASAAALGRLGHWPAAADVAPLLRDATWDVRRAAGETLVSLGAPGLLLLRRMLDDDDVFARDMAQQALEVAELRATVHG